MDLLWWLPTAVLAVGSLALLRRVRVVEARVATTDAAIRDLGAVAEAAHTLGATVSDTGSRRSRTSDALSRPHRSQPSAADGRPGVADQ